MFQNWQFIYFSSNYSWKNGCNWNLKWKKQFLRTCFLTESIGRYAFSVCMCVIHAVLSCVYGIEYVNEVVFFLFCKTIWNVLCHWFLAGGVFVSHLFITLLRNKRLMHMASSEYCCISMLLNRSVGECIPSKNDRPTEKKRHGFM